MCCPAASVYILCVILLTACKIIHFTNSCRVRGFTQISAIMLTPSREISNNRLQFFLNSENLSLFFGKSARHFG